MKPTESCPDSNYGPANHLSRLFSPRFWQILGLMLAALFIFSILDSARYNFNWTGDTGFKGGLIIPEPQFQPGYGKVYFVVPGGAMEKAGIVKGDHIRFDRPFDYLRAFHKGDRIDFTLNRNGKTTHIETVGATPYPFSAEILAAILTSHGTSLIHVCLGLFLLWRGGRNMTTIVLGLALICFSAGEGGMILSANPFIFQAYYIFVYLCLALFPILFVAFAIRFLEDTSAKTRPWMWRLLTAFGGLGAALAILSAWVTIYLIDIGSIGDYRLISLIISALCLCACIYVLLKGWAEAGPDARQRFVILLVTLCMMIAGNGLLGLSGFIMADDFDASLWVVVLANLLIGVVFPLLLVYAALRHKVFDLGFAINRTLVYGTLSALLLVAFGFGEWAFEHYLPFKSHGTNILVDAGLAVAIFLVFHRVRDAVEHVIEKIFFHTWQQNEAALKRFVKQAGFVTKTDPLMQATIAELMRFTGGAEVALYLKDETDLYVRREGALKNAPETIDPDHPLLVTLRAEREPLEPDATQHTTLNAALVLPMVQRNELTGFVLLSGKPDASGYRPDEIDILGWAAQHIGLDLHALKVESLGVSDTYKSQIIAILEARNDELRLALNQSK